SWNLAQTSAKYVAAVNIDDTGVVVVAFQANAGNGLPTELDSTTLVFTPSIDGLPLADERSGPIEWACASSSAITATNRSLFVSDPLGTLPAKYAPSECR